MKPQNIAGGIGKALDVIGAECAVDFRAGGGRVGNNQFFSL
jgi:hypothetical protein